MKKCTLCGQEFPATREYFNLHTKGRLQPRCKKCQSKMQRETYKKYNEKWIEYARQYREENAVELAQRRKEKYENNKEEILKKFREYRKNNPKFLLKERARKKSNYHNNKFLYSLQNKIWRQNNPESCRAYHVNRRARIRNADGRYNKNDIETLYLKQNGICAYCDEKLKDTFHIDHIIPLSRGGSNWPDNLALSCPRCNLSKGTKLLSEWKGYGI
jgi:5-methylcytosine-specific restriction endonuclease McrA